MHRILPFILIIAFYSCSKAGEEASNFITDKDVFTRSLVGLWQGTDCHLEGDSEYFHQARFWKIDQNLDFTYYNVLYTQGDSHCTNPPIAMNVGSGQLVVGRQSEISKGVFALEFHFDSLTIEGNAVLGQPTLLDESTPVIFHASGASEGNILLLETPRRSQAVALTVPKTIFQEIDVLPDHLSEFQPIPVYSAPVVSDFYGKWRGICRTSSDLYRQWTYSFSPPNQVTIVETLYSGGNCSGYLADISYSGTYAIPGPITTSNLTPVEAAKLDFNFNDIQRSAGEYIGYFVNYGDTATSTTVTLTSLIDKDYNIMLESIGDGVTDADRPTELYWVFQLTEPYAGP